jgi:hypothetical protein
MFEIDRMHDIYGNKNSATLSWSLNDWFSRAYHKNQPSWTSRKRFGLGRNPLYRTIERKDNNILPLRS